MNELNIEHLTILSTLRTKGISTSAELQLSSRKSQATVSRLLADLGPQVLAMGQGRNTRYALPVSIHGQPAQQPVWWVDEAGARWRVGTLSLLAGEQIHLAFGAADLTAKATLPWFLQPLRAQGFLGRLLAVRLQQSGLTTNPERWGLESMLFAALQLHDAPGALLLGEQPGTYEQAPSPPVLPLQQGALHATLDALAQNLTGLLPAGSSAGGEQPKFLAVLESGQHVLVKYTPPRGTPFGERWHDLLHAEALAADVLSEHGFLAARCSVLRSAQRTYLVSERFDRVGGAGRSHVVSVGAVHDGLLGGPYTHWAASCEALAQRRHLDAEDAAQARTLLGFGHLIGNTDMHSGNLSLRVFVPDLRQRRFSGRLSLAPIYDMLPMRWRPNPEMGGAADYSPFEPHLLNIAGTAYAPAMQFWEQLAQWTVVSKALRTVAADMAARLRTAAPQRSLA